MTKNESIIQTRLTAIRQKFEEWEVDGLLISSPQNRRWLSGFTGSAGKLLITQDKALLATDFRYFEQATAQAPDFELFKHRRTPEDDNTLFTAFGTKRIGIEAQHITLNIHSQLQKIEGVTWVPLAETAEPLRQIKTPAEIAAIRAAAAITDQAMAQVNTLAKPGMSEKVLAWALEKTMRENGADGIAFDTIVASGPNAALPHHSPGERPLQLGDILIVDMGALLDGYHSDLTRTFYLGAEPDEQFWSIYYLVQEAQTAVLDNIKPGLTGKETDALARDVITQGGYGEQFGHGLGHGIGLEIHETPIMNKTGEKDIIAAGLALTIEPGIYISGWGGVRIEDLIVVTDDGFEYISHCPKEPVIGIL
jgi:Xaa-Pro aminopeptidase